MKVNIKKSLLRAIMYSCLLVIVLCVLPLMLGHSIVIKLNFQSILDSVQFYQDCKNSTALLNLIKYVQVVYLARYFYDKLLIGLGIIFLICTLVRFFIFNRIRENIYPQLFPNILVGLLVTVGCFGILFSHDTKPKKEILTLSDKGFACQVQFYQQPINVGDLHSIIQYTVETKLKLKYEILGVNATVVLILLSELYILILCGYKIKSTRFTGSA
jgi:hypothetical protein